MVLHREQRRDGRPVAQREDADLLALERFLDHHARPGLAERPGHHETVDGRHTLVGGRGDRDALPGREAVGLDHERAARPFDIGRGQVWSIKDLERSGRDPVPTAQSLHEDLARLERRGGLGGPEDRNPALRKGIDDPRGERRLRSHNREIDLFRLGALRQGARVVGGQREAFGDLGDSGVARGAKERGALLAEPPHNRVLPTPRADHKNSHQTLHVAVGSEDRSVFDAISGRWNDELRFEYSIDERVCQVSVNCSDFGARTPPLRRVRMGETP